MECALISRWDRYTAKRFKLKYANWCHFFYIYIYFFFQPKEYIILSFFNTGFEQCAELTFFDLMLNFP